MRPVPLLLLWLSLLGLSGRPLQAQDAAAVGTIQGTVLDASTSSELPGSQVTLLPRGGDGALPAVEGRTPFVNAYTTMTSADGAYRFVNLPPGEYTLLVRRVGYEPARLDVTLGSAGDARLSIGLMVLPVRLQPVSIEATRLQTARDSLAANEGALRVAAARERQRMFLSTDVREITTADVQEAATLGSGDVLLAMQRLPSVTHVHPGSATMWVRGARWAQTRVYFDGIPLFEPLGGEGTLSGTGAFSVGAAFLHPGVRPVSLGGEGAARVDLRSPTGPPDGKVHGAAEVSLLGVSGAASHRAADGRLGMHVTARRSLGEFTTVDQITYGGPANRFNNITARADAAVGAARIEGSGIFVHDRRLSLAERYGNEGRSMPLPPDSVQRRTAAGRLTVTHPIGAMRASLTASLSRFDGRTMQPHFTNTLPALTGDWPPYSPVDVGAGQFQAGARIESWDSASSSGWKLGADLNDYRADFSGRRQHLVWGEQLSTEVLEGAGALRFGSLWAERRWSPRALLELEAGLRVDAGGRGLPALRPAPTIAARYALTPAASLAAGIGRTHQYTQQLDLPQRLFAPTTVTGPILVAGSGSPLLTVDHVTAGIEHWRSAGTLLAANAYARRTTGMALSEPMPGELIDRPLFETGHETAVGLELSARKLTGRATFMLAYSVGRAWIDADTSSFVSPSDRTHAVDATASVRLGSWRLGSAYTLTSGSVFTRMTPGMFPDGDPANGWAQRPVAERPNDGRAPGYSRLDLLADWTAGIRRTRLSVHGGVQNILRSPMHHWASRAESCPSASTGSVTCRNGDMFFVNRAIKFTLGVRLAF